MFYSFNIISATYSMGSNLMILEVDELTWQTEMRLVKSS